MRRIWILLFVAAAVLGIVLLIAASPIDPEPYHPPTRPALQGPLAPNSALQDAELLGKGHLPGPEDVEVDSAGRVYCGLADGTVRRLVLSPAGERVEAFADTGGRPLGLDFDSEGTLWIADSVKGLVSVDPLGTVTVRSAEVDGTPIGFADDVDAASDGPVFFSDASTRFGADQLLLDTLEARPHGRLLEYDPDSGRTRVLLQDLYFANGVSVSPDQSFVLVCETFRYRIRRYWLRGPQAGRDEVFVDNLPGFPDGVSVSEKGTFWVAIYALRNDLLDRFLHPHPWLKRIVAGLPERLQSGINPYGLVLALDAAGRYLRSLHDPTGERVPSITSVEARSGYLYLGTVEGDAVGRTRIP